MNNNKKEERRGDVGEEKACVRNVRRRSARSWLRLIRLYPKLDELSGIVLLLTTTPFLRFRSRPLARPRPRQRQAAESSHSLTTVVLSTSPNTVAPSHRHIAFRIQQLRDARHCRTAAACFCRYHYQPTSQFYRKLPQHHNACGQS